MSDYFPVTDLDKLAAEWSVDISGIDFDFNEFHFTSLLNTGDQNHHSNAPDEMPGDFTLTEAGDFPAELDNISGDRTAFWDPFRLQAPLAETSHTTDMFNASYMDGLESIGCGIDHVGANGLGHAGNSDSWNFGGFRGHVPMTTQIRADNIAAPARSASTPSLEEATDSVASHSFTSFHTCAQCHDAFPHAFFLEWHAKEELHKAYRCNVEGCEVRLASKTELESHQRRPHLEDHRRVEYDRPYVCEECRTEFRNKSKLQQHANEAQHSPFACTCGSKFARLDVLNRHLDSFGDKIPKHPCQFCKKHRGKNGFHRKDHLLQHIRGYHKFEAEGKIGDILPSRRGKHHVPPVCPHKDCSYHRGESFMKLRTEEQRRNKPFESQSEYTKHMKVAHNESKYPCNVAGCNKTGGRGYSREKDLINHRRKEHPDANAYTAQPRDIRIPCRQSGCDTKVYPNSMENHLRRKHTDEWRRMNLS